MLTSCWTSGVCLQARVLRAVPGARRAPVRSFLLVFGVSSSVCVLGGCGAGGTAGPDATAGSGVAGLGGTPDSGGALAGVGAVGADPPTVPDVGVPTEQTFGLQIRPTNTTCVPPESPSRPAQNLVDTGCVDPENPKNPAPGLIPYTIASPLWSDGTTKGRYMALPEGASIQVKSCAETPDDCKPLLELGTPGDDGHWDFPVGTVLVKTFDWRVAGWKPGSWCALPKTPGGATPTSGTSMARKRSCCPQPRAGSPKLCQTAKAEPKSGIIPARPNA